MATNISLIDWMEFRVCTAKIHAAQRVLSKKSMNMSLSIRHIIKTCQNACLLKVFSQNTSLRPLPRRVEPLWDIFISKIFYHQYFHPNFTPGGQCPNRASPGDLQLKKFVYNDHGFHRKNIS